MSECYEFIPGPEKCSIVSYEETLGRSVQQQSASSAIILRSIAHDPTMNGVWSVVTQMKNSAGNPISNAGAVSVCASVDVTVTDGNGVHFNNFPQVSSYNVAAVYPIEPLSWPVSAVNAVKSWMESSTDIRIVGSDYTVPNIVSFPDHLDNFNAILNGAGGRPIVPGDSVRTGPEGAMIHIQSSENPDPNSDGSPIEVEPPNSVLLFNCDTLLWEVRPV